LGSRATKGSVGIVIIYTGLAWTNNIANLLTSSRNFPCPSPTLNVYNMNEMMHVNTCSKHFKGEVGENTNVKTSYLLIFTIDVFECIIRGVLLQNTKD
jgi:hypothetical protein